MHKITKNKKAITLIELFIVVVIVGILAVFAMPAYLNAKRRAADHEAQTHLQLLQAAERIVCEETNSYTACAGNCNTSLRINVPESATWTYNAIPVGASCTAVGASFCIEATGSAGNSNWHINDTDAAPSALDCSGN